MACSGESLKNGWVEARIGAKHARQKRRRTGKAGRYSGLRETAQRRPDGFARHTFSYPWRDSGCCVRLRTVLPRGAGYAGLAAWKSAQPAHIDHGSGGNRQNPKESCIMKTKHIALSLLISLAAVSGAASAKGCIKGAVVGGVAGHIAGHGKVGAAAGCVIGHHSAKKKEKEQAAQQAAAQQAAAQPAPQPAPARK
jgi:hypothetical protein